MDGAATNYRLISCDDHLDLGYLPRDVWTARLAAKYAGRAPHIEERDGRGHWISDGKMWGGWHGIKPPASNAPPPYLTALNRVARLRIGLGVFRWSPDESRILLKRALEKKSGDLVWIDLPPLSTVPANSANQTIPVSQPIPTPILHGLTFRDFAISPDGRFLAVVITGKRNLHVFPLPR